MNSGHDPNHRSLLARVIVPVANETDAEKTARALEPYEPRHVTELHVVEKGEGIPDKKPVEQTHEVAAKSFAAVREVFPAAEKHTAYARDIVEAIFEATNELGASAIAYRSRGGGRLMQFLSGDLPLQLVTQTDQPVIALPEERLINEC